MIIGVTAEFNTTVIRNSAYTFDAVPVLHIVKPDTTTDVSSVVGSVPTFSTSAVSHVLQAFYTPATVGKFSSQWKYSIASQQYSETSIPFQVTYTDVNNAVRTLLGVSVGALPDSRLDIQFRQFMLFLVARVPTFDYTTLVGNDQELFDGGVEYILASRLRSSFANSVPSGELTEIRQGPVTYRYSSTITNMLRGSSVPIQQIWLELGIELLASISTLTAFMQVLANSDVQHETGTRDPQHRHHDEWGRYDLCLPERFIGVRWPY